MPSGDPFSSVVPVCVVHALTSAHVCFCEVRTHGDISKCLHIYKIDQFQFLRRPDWKAERTQCRTPGRTSSIQSSEGRRSWRPKHKRLSWSKWCLKKTERKIDWKKSESCKISVRIFLKSAQKYTSCNFLIRLRQLQLGDLFSAHCSGLFTSHTRWKGKKRPDSLVRRTGRRFPNGRSRVAASVAGSDWSAGELLAAGFLVVLRSLSAPVHFSLWFLRRRTENTHTWMRRCVRALAAAQLSRLLAAVRVVCFDRLPP